MLADVELLYKDLSVQAKALSDKFINPYIPADPGVSPDVYMLDVKAYCVLSHAMFEDFIENVALSVACNAVDNWLATRRLSDVLLTLLCWNGAGFKIDTDKNSSETKPFDYIKPLIENAKSEFSRKVHGNHGVSKQYLRNLLTPVAIEINSDLNLLNSLDKLSEGRGLYAHKGRVKTVIAPEDAKRYVEDVLKLCNDVRAKAAVYLTA